MRPSGLGDDHTVLNESGPPKTGWCVPARTEPKLPSDIVVVISSCLHMKIAITFRRPQKQPDVWNFTGELYQKAEQVRTDFVWNGDYPWRGCIVLKVSGSIERRRTVPVTSPGHPKLEISIVQPVCQATGVLQTVWLTPLLVKQALNFIYSTWSSLPQRRMLPPAFAKYL